MTTFTKFAIQKLVRDKIKERMLECGYRIHAYQLSTDADYIAALKTKLIEEAHEVKEASTTQELCNELADVVELMHAIMQQTSITWDDIEQRRAQHNVERGAFDERQYIEHIEVDSDSEWYDYYRQRPLQYPEVK